jgi:hypothetical protein
MFDEMCKKTYYLSSLSAKVSQLAESAAEIDSIHTI